MFLLLTVEQGEAVHLLQAGLRIPLWQDELCATAKDKRTGFTELSQTVREHCDAEMRACLLKCWDLWTRFRLDPQPNQEGMLLS